MPRARTPGTLNPTSAQWELLAAVREDLPTLQLLIADAADDPGCTLAAEFATSLRNYATLLTTLANTVTPPPQRVYQDA